MTCIHGTIAYRKHIVTKERRSPEEFWILPTLAVRIAYEFGILILRNREVGIVAENTPIEASATYIVYIYIHIIYMCVYVYVCTMRVYICIFK